MSIDDRRLGDVALRKGWIHQDDLQGALDLIATLRRRGQTKSLGQILVAEGRITADQLDTLEADAGSEVLACSNTDCGRRFSIRSFDPQKTYRCKACGERLGFPTEMQATSIDVAGDSALELAAVRSPAGADTEAQTVYETPRPAERPSGRTARPDTLGRYVGVVELARGGMGAIYRAVDPEVGRPVAIKVLRPGLAEDDMLSLRFLREARVTGQLQHPNIPPLYEVSRTADGRLYFTLKLIEGTSLAEFLELHRRGKVPGDPLQIRRRLIGDLVKVCDALAYAHSRGVVHRDLKPANIMLGEYGEVLLMDWGIAKIQDEAEPEPGERPVRRTVQTGAIQTLHGAIMGTPSYMSPEQADGAIDRIDERSDVYSMGAVLYEVLALESPYAGRNTNEVLREIGSGKLDPPSIRKPTARIPAELDAVVLKAMHPKPTRRYQDVREFKEDLEAYLQNRALAAVRYTRLQLAAKWARRHKAMSVGLAAAAVALLLGAISAVSLQRAAERRKARGLVDEGAQKVRDGDFQAAQTDLTGALALIRDDEEALRLLGEAAAGAEAQRRHEAAVARAREVRIQLRLARTAAEGLPLPGMEQERTAWHMAHSEVVALARELERLLPDDPEGRETLSWSALSMARQARQDQDWTLASLMLAEAKRTLPREVLALEEKLIEDDRQRRMRDEVDAVQRILDDLQTPPEAELFEQSVTDVVKMPHPHVVRELVPAVFSGLEWQRRLAIEGLGRIGDAVSQAETKDDVPAEPLPGAAVGDGARSRLADRYALLRRTWVGTDEPATLDPVEALSLRLLATSFASEIDEAITTAWALGRLRDHRALAPLYEKRLASGGDSFFLKRTLLPFQWLLQECQGCRDHFPDLETAGEYLVRAGERFVVGDLEGAFADVDRSVRLDPDVADAWSLRGYVERKRGHWDVALPNLREAVRLDPGSPLHLARLADTLVAAFQTQEAIEVYTAALQLTPDDVSILIGRAEARTLRNEFAGAEADISRALALAPRSVEAILALGYLRRARWDLPGARGAFDQALELDPQLEEAYRERAFVRTWLGEYDGAIDDASIAIRLDPRSAKGYVIRGTACRARGDLSKAIDDYGKAIGLEGSNALAWAYRGQCRVQSGDPAGLEDSDYAIALAPDQSELYAFRAMALVQLERWDDAEADLIQGLQLDTVRFPPQIKASILQMFEARNYAGIKAVLIPFQAIVPKDMLEQARTLLKIIDRRLQQE